MPTMGLCYRCGAEIAIDSERGMCKRCAAEGTDSLKPPELFASAPVATQVTETENFPPKKGVLRRLTDQLLKALIR